MFDEKDLVLEAKHVTRKFPTNDGRLLTACNEPSHSLSLVCLAYFAECIDFLT